MDHEQPNSVQTDAPDSLGSVLERLARFTMDEEPNPDLKNVEQAVERIEPHLPVRLGK